MRFAIGGAQYPDEFPWTPNIFFVRHLEPAQHPAFFCSSRLTLNVTRRAMKAMGYCPSGRLFEAAACGTPLAYESGERPSDLDMFLGAFDEPEKLPATAHVWTEARIPWFHADQHSPR